MKANAIYEVEIQRSNVTPRRFWGICKREFERRTGGKYSLEDWLDGFDVWSDPLMESNFHNGNEICRTLPYEFQFWVKDGFNFIMEFNFWDDKTGNGYLYAVELER